MSLAVIIPVAVTGIFLLFMVALAGTALYVRLGEQRK